MTLDEIHESIKRAVGRGAQQDGVIPDIVRDAAAVIEADYSYRYMRKISSVTIDPVAMSPERIDFPSDRVKAFRFVRVATLIGGGPTTDAYRYLVGVEPEEVTALSSGPPVGYYQDGVDQLVLDSVPTESTRLEMAYTEYTSWPTDGAATPWLCRVGHPMLRAQTMVNFAGELRDPRLEEIWAPRLKMAFSAFQRAEEEAINNDKEAVMQYGAR